VGLRYAHDFALHVSDNGIGIDPTIVDRGKHGHFGLQGMRERTSRIGGKLTPGSSSNSGTDMRLNRTWRHPIPQNHPLSMVFVCKDKKPFSLKGPILQSYVIRWPGLSWVG
jgi:hypothetical protein